MLFGLLERYEFSMNLIGKSPVRSIMQSVTSLPANCVPTLPVMSAAKCNQTFHH